MRASFLFPFIGIFGLLFFFQASAQQDSTARKYDTAELRRLDALNQKLIEIEKRRLEDSIQQVTLIFELSRMKVADSIKRRALEERIKKNREAEDERLTLQKTRIDSLKAAGVGYPVIGPLYDTLLYIYTSFGSSSAAERAERISKRIINLYDSENFVRDSLISYASDFSVNIMYGDMGIMSVTEMDALWYEKSVTETAEDLKTKIADAIVRGRISHSPVQIALRVAKFSGILALTGLVMWLLAFGKRKLVHWLASKKQSWIRGFTYKNYTFISAEQEIAGISKFLQGLLWLAFLIILSIGLRLAFDIFPATRGWNQSLFRLILDPFIDILRAIWHYLPNLFSILAIIIVMMYALKAIRYIFREIDQEKLQIPGFHADWAMPTFSIVRFLHFAFLLVLVFPYLPGSHSPIFKGVSVFIGLLFSIGSSSAIGNLVAGLVITYMRPFKIGDRIRIDDVTGDVIEKSLLVTRLRSTKNEIITLPNSTVLAKNTINYSTESRNPGLIVHTTITIGYNSPWQDVHQALTDAALRMEKIMKEPQPFVLQTALNDSYVSYQLNAYTQYPNEQLKIYSELHGHIQDVFNERGIEIMSPTYLAARDGNANTIPDAYLPKDYKSPGFHFKQE